MIGRASATGARAASPRHLAVPLARAALVVAVAVVLGWQALAFARLAGAEIAYPYQIDYDEGVNLSAARALGHLVDVYAPLEPGHFLSAPYTPLYLVVVAAADRWLDAALPVGRAVSVLAALGVVGLIALAVRRASGSAMAGGLAGLMFLAFGPVQIWAGLLKQDLPALLLSLAGVYAAARVRPGRELWALPWFVAAWYTKQSAVAGAAAVILYLLLVDWRRGLRFGAAYVALLAVPFALLTVLTHGGFFEHILVFQLHGAPWTLDRLAKNLSGLAAIYLPVLLVALVGAAVLPRSRQRAIWLCFLVTSALALITAGTNGANYNHLIEIWPAVCVVVGLWLGQLLSFRNPAALVPLAVVVGLVGVTLAVQPAARGTWYSDWRLPSDARAERLARVIDLIRQTPGNVLVEDQGLALLAGKPVWYDDPSTMAPLARDGVWDDSRLARELRERRFSLLALDVDLEEYAHRDDLPRWSPATLSAIREGYELEYRDVAFVYRPRPNPASPARDLSAAFAEGLVLEGFTANRQQASAGDALRVTLYWTAQARPGRDYVGFLHLVDAAGNLVAQHDGPPGGGRTSAWSPGASQRDERVVVVPAGAPPGRYRLVAGLYDPTNLRRLALVGGQEGDSVTIAELVVESQGPRPRF